MLMNSGVEIAGRMIEEHGGFIPYALTLDDQEEVRTISPGEEHAQLSPEELLGMFDDMFREEHAAGKLRATAVFVGVSYSSEATEEGHAIMIALEHFEGEALNVYFPYTRSDDGKVEVGEPFSESRESSVF